VKQGPSILRITLLAEGALLIIALPWFLSSRSSYTITPDIQAVIWGAGTALLLLTASFLLDRMRIEAMEDFRDNVVLPLCKKLSVRDALVIALASGVAEELLFRGLIQEELTNLTGLVGSILLTNLLFAYIHIIGSVRRYLPLLFVYIGAGIIFSLATHLTGNLLPAMLAHTIFNFVSILWMKNRVIE